MKTYSQLSVKQQEKACVARLKELLEIALDGGQRKHSQTQRQTNCRLLVLPNVPMSRTQQP